MSCGFSPPEIDPSRTRVGGEGISSARWTFETFATSISTPRVRRRGIWVKVGAPTRRGLARFPVPLHAFWHWHLGFSQKLHMCAGRLRLQYGHTRHPQWSRHAPHVWRFLYSEQNRQHLSTSMCPPELGFLPKLESPPHTTRAWWRS